MGTHKDSWRTGHTMGTTRAGYGTATRRGTMSKKKRAGFVSMLTEC